MDFFIPFSFATLAQTKLEILHIKQNCKHILTSQTKKEPQYQQHAGT